MAADPIDIAVTGASGRMGRMLARAVLEEPGCRLVAATDRPGAEAIGSDIGPLIGEAPLGVIVEDDPLPVFARVRAVIDFTTPDASVEHAALAAQARLVHVIGTTGFSPEHLDAVAAAARHATIVRAGNMSLGVNLLVELVRQAAGALGTDYDIEVVEMHHRHKVDAPSGTAYMLADAAAEGREVALDDAARKVRDGQTGPRETGTIRMQSLRGGDVVGEHDVILAGEGERVVLRHIATDRMLFARGAVRAALWGVHHGPGEYGMADVLGLRASATAGAA